MHKLTFSLQYTFDGYLHIIYTGQDFDILNTGMVYTGKEILAMLYDNKNVNAWGMIGVLIAYIIFFRVVHYAIFLYASLPFLASNKPDDEGRADIAKDLDDLTGLGVSMQPRSKKEGGNYVPVSNHGQERRDVAGEMV